MMWGCNIKCQLAEDRKSAGQRMVGQNWSVLESAKKRTAVNRVNNRVQRSGQELQAGQRKCVSRAEDMVSAGQCTGAISAKGWGQQGSVQGSAGHRTGPVRKRTGVSGALDGISRA